MRTLKLTLRAIGSFVSQAWLLPCSFVLAIKQKRQRIEFEVERLDRIRNPSKYLGK